jgi:hypothetical protein
LSDAYTLLGRDGPDHARIRFEGTLRGACILWDAEVMTLERAARETGVPQRRQFIDVQQVHEGAGRIVTGLAVPAIDAPTLLKAVMMLRQWKGLGPGRHEFDPFTRDP